MDTGMSDEEWEIHLAEVKQKRGIIAKGRHTEVCGRELPDVERVAEVKAKRTYNGGGMRHMSFQEWFKTLSRRKPD
jgi:hypothetical protein